MTPQTDDVWGKLTDEQLRGANYALRVVRTSPRIRGAALDLVDSLIADTHPRSKVPEEVAK